jgi:hypothetical protein
MPLVPQTIDIPFEGGLDTSTDRRKVIPGKLLELENARFVGTSLEMRSGTSFLADGVVGGGSLSSAVAVAERDSELLRWTADGVYGRSSADAPWVRRSSALDATPLLFDVYPQVQRPRNCDAFDCATLLGITVYVWTEGEQTSGTTTRRRLYATVIDNNTGVRHQDAMVVDTADDSDEAWRVHPRLVTAGGTVILVYGLPVLADGPVALYARALLPGSPQSFTARALVANPLYQATQAFRYAFDVIDLTTGPVTSTSPGTFVLASGGTSGVELRWFTVATTAPGTFTPSGAVTTQAPTTGGATAQAFTHVRLGKLADLSRLFLTFRQTLTNRLELHTFRTSDRVRLSGADLAAVVDGKVAMAEMATGSMTAFVEGTGKASGQDISRVTWNAAGAITASVTVWIQCMRLAGIPCQVGGSWVVPCYYVDTRTNTSGPDLPGIQPTFFLLDAATARVRARALEGEAGAPVTSTWHLPHNLGSGAVASVPLLRRGRLEIQVTNGAIIDLTPSGIVRAEFSSASPSVLGRLYENGLLHVGGALPAIYDGAQWVEDGFNLQPEGMTATVLATTGGGLSAGSYSWGLVYEWTDSTGRIHRSAPHVPIRLTVVANSIVSLRMPFLFVTSKVGVRLSLFRTQANGTTMYRLGTSQQAYGNVDPSAGPGNTFLEYRDSASDASITDNEVLTYGGPQGGTSGGELWHRPPPAYASIHQHMEYVISRVMGAPFSYAYTLPVLVDAAPAWAVELRLVIPSTHGRAVASASLDATLILLAERGCFAVVGQGPAADGTSNGFTSPQHVTGSAGCRSAASVVSTPDGLMYQGKDGFYLLSRSLETVKLGAPVDAFSSLSVVRALEVLVAATTANPSGRREVRWYTAEGRTLVYDLTNRQWGTDTGQPASDACLMGGLPHFSDGVRVRYDDASSILEGGSIFSSVIGTAWLKWGGFVGLERVWRVVLLGTLRPTTKVKAELFHDYQEAAPGSTTEQVYQGAAVGGPEVFNLRQTPGRQLCTALRARWTLTPQPTGPVDTGKVGLTSVTLEVGVHPRASKRRQQYLGG